MTCPRCHSTNVTAQIVTEAQLVDKHHGFFWWLCIGWWWIPFKWLFLTLPALIAKIFIPKKQRLKHRQETHWVCQDCGNSWHS